jgi:Flp pilus assembly protein TadB
VFIVVFSIFIAAIFVLCVLILRWAVRRDRERRATQPGPDGPR